MAEHDITSENLVFDDPGSQRSKWVAGGVVLLTLLWMGSGYILPADDGSGEKPQPVATVPAVEVMAISPEIVSRDITVAGVSRPVVETKPRFEISGIIEQVHVARGDEVRKGDLLISLETTTLAADLAKTTSEVSRLTRELDNAIALKARGATTENRVLDLMSALENAEATAVIAARNLEKAQLRAPHDGRIERVDAQAGGVATTADQPLHLAHTQTLLVEAIVAQHQRSELMPDMPVEVTFLTGEQRPGMLTFVSSVADDQVRGYDIEAIIENADKSLAAGQSLTVTIPVGAVSAYRISPAYLSLDSNGRIGIKTLSAGDRVAFQPVDIVKSDTTSLWVTGPEANITMITTGQAFVNDGDIVRPIRATAGSMDDQ